MKELRSYVMAAGLIAMMMVFVGTANLVHAQDSAKAAKASGSEATAEKATEKPKEAGMSGDAPYSHVTFKEGEKPIVVMETSMGTMEIELWPDVAPHHCKSFVHLIQKGFYDSLMFHRVIPGFVIQGGDPLGNGTGGPGYNVPAEFSNLKHDDGILSMARANDPNSAGSQFFICLSRQGTASLDNKYSIFGKVVSGLEVAHQIEKVPTSRGDKPTAPVYMTKVFVKPAGAAAESE